MDKMLRKMMEWFIKQIKDAKHFASSKEYQSKKMIML